jgi:hypothetical protein
MLHDHAACLALPMKTLHTTRSSLHHLRAQVDASHF